MRQTGQFADTAVSAAAGSEVEDDAAAGAGQADRNRQRRARAAGAAWGRRRPGAAGRKLRSSLPYSRRDDKQRRGQNTTGGNASLGKFKVGEASKPRTRERSIGIGLEAKVAWQLSDARE